MKKSSLIGHLVELLDGVRTRFEPADNLAKDFFRLRRYLGSRDRRFVTETLYAILRNFTLLKTFLEQSYSAVKAPLPAGGFPSLALYAALAVKIRNEIPSTILPDIAGLWRVFVPNIDSTVFLDQLTRSEVPSPILQDPVLRLAVIHSMPESIVREWIDRYGGEEAEQLCRALNEPAPITVRVNTLKVSVEECRHALNAEGIASSPTMISPYGLTLSKRVNAPSLNSFKQGFFEMQDEGSQLLSMLLEPASNETVIDACAGSGGKTLHLAALMQNSGVLYSFDVKAQRLKNLGDRIARAGVANTRVCLAERDREVLSALREKADKVLIDAPCSGVGTFRRNPGAKLSFTPDFVHPVSATQRSVLEIYSQTVRPGGRLVYSTCTLLQQENEYAVESFLLQHPEFSLLSAPDILRRQGIHIDGASPFLTLLPHKTSTDGFFAAVMQRVRY